MIKLTIFRSAAELEKLRPLWERLCRSTPITIFQQFELNRLAAELFAGREQPFVVSAEASYGAAIVPAVVRQSDGTIRLLGEELFDYRGFLQEGDAEVLRSALAALAGLRKALMVIAMRPEEGEHVPEEMPLADFSAAPAIRVAELPESEFSIKHLRLARNLRRLQRLGYEMQRYEGSQPGLLAHIYQLKAAQDPNSLFHDPLRVQFMARAAHLLPQHFEIFTLECGRDMAAAVVTLRDGHVRRFYTGWFAPELSKHSPCLSLIYEVTRRSLAEGMDCDYMTGEQPYKQRLATTSVPLRKLHASAEQIAALTETPVAELDLAS
ncbi:MAG TPA: GNAT family N-acetyltransferase [Terriglobales bacterium]|nr:GNAT family N-acetyltransferase [Terriglobales bacterium]